MPGYMTYHGVPGSYAGVKSFRTQVIRLGSVLCVVGAIGIASPGLVLVSLRIVGSLVSEFCSRIQTRGFAPHTRGRSRMR